MGNATVLGRQSKQDNSVKTVNSGNSTVKGNVIYNYAPPGGASPPAINVTVPGSGSSGGLAASVAFDFGDTPFRAQSTFQKVASTYAKGTKILMPAGGAVYPVPSGDNGHQRKTIIFIVYATKVQILDLNANVVARDDINSPIAIETDAAFLITNEPGAGTGAGAYAAIGEIYYA